MHLASAEHRYWGGHAIVGGHLPLRQGGAAIAIGRSPTLSCVSWRSTPTSATSTSRSSGCHLEVAVVYLVENNSMAWAPRSAELCCFGYLSEGLCLRHR